VGLNGAAGEGGAGVHESRALVSQSERNSDRHNI